MHLNVGFALLRSRETIRNAAGIMRSHTWNRNAKIIYYREGIFVFRFRMQIIVGIIR